MEENYKRALTEVDCILQNTDKEITDKIPQKFFEFIKKYEDKNYNFCVKANKKIEEQNLMKESKYILALIYRDYICTKEEHAKLLIEEKKKDEEIKQKNKEKYEINFEKNIPNKKINDKNLSEENKKLITPINTHEKWYKKVWNKLLKIFNRKAR